MILKEFILEKYLSQIRDNKDLFFFDFSKENLN